MNKSDEMIDFRSSKDPEGWDSFLKRTNRSVFYHQWEWGKILEQCEGYKIIRVEAIGDDGDIVGIFPTAIKCNNAISIPNTHFCGPIVSEFLDINYQQTVHEGLVRFMEKILKLLKIQKNIIIHWSRKTNSRLLKLYEKKLGYRLYTVTPTYVLDLKEPIENIVRNYRKGFRIAIKEAEKRGCKIKINDPELLNPIYNLYIESMKNVGEIPRYSLKTLKYLLNIKNDSINLFACIYGENLIGFCYLLNHKFCSIYLLASMKRQFQKFRPSNLLLDAAIKDAKVYGSQFIDIGGAPTSGIKFFKESTGALPEEVYYYSKILNRHTYYSFKVWRKIHENMLRIKRP